MQMTKSIGKPYEGKPHVRFDEGMLKVNGRPCEGSPIKISIILYNFMRDEIINVRSGGRVSAFI